MVTEAEFDRVQILLGRKGQPRNQKRSFLYTGAVRCGECGGTVTAEQKDQIICSKPKCKTKFSYIKTKECPKCGTAIEEMKNPTILKYVYYHCSKRKKCSCKQKSLSAETLEKQFDNHLSKIEIDSEYMNFAIKRLKDTHQSESSSRSSILKSRQNAYNKASKRLDGLLELRLNNEINEAEYLEKKTSLIKEKDQMQESLREIDQDQNKWLELSEKTFNFACYAKYWFANGDPEQKRQIFIALGSNLTLKDKNLIIELKKPFQMITEAIQEIPQLTTFEPEKMGVYKRKNRVFRCGS